MLYLAVLANLGLLGLGGGLRLGLSIGSDLAQGSGEDRSLLSGDVDVLGDRGVGLGLFDRNNFLNRRLLGLLDGGGGGGGGGDDLGLGNNFSRNSNLFSLGNSWCRGF